MGSPVCMILASPSGEISQIPPAFSVIEPNDKTPTFTYPLASTAIESKRRPSGNA